MKKIILLLISMALFGGCNFLEIEPVGKVIPHTVSDYRAMLTAAYEHYPAHKQNLMLPSDEVGDLSNDYSNKEANILNLTWRAESSIAQEYSYIGFYKTIFYANEIIDKIADAEVDGLVENKEQILAEAHAIRAYCYFDLLNMYAKWYDVATASTDKGVPLPTEIDIKQEFPRSSVAEGYELILSDLKIAMDNVQVETPVESYKYRFSKLSIIALESRVRLYMGDWDNALDLAKQAIVMAETSGISLVDLVATPNESPYAATSSESILALEEPFQGDVYNRDGTYISDEMLALYTADDARLDNYIREAEIMSPTFAFRYVYRPIKESERVSIRLSELYLNVAEAAIKKSAPDIVAARNYLGALQENRFTAKPDLTAMTSEQLITEIANERARELIMEGHRWFDLRRTTRPAMKKKLLVVWYMDWDTFEEVKEYEEYTINADDPRYTLPFPRSAKLENVHLN